MMATQSRQKNTRRAIAVATWRPDEEGKIERLVGRLAVEETVPAEPAGEQHRVAEAGHREQLGDALDDADDDRL